MGNNRVSVLRLFFVSHYQDVNMSEFDRLAHEAQTGLYVEPEKVPVMWQCPLCGELHTRGKFKRGFVGCKPCRETEKKKRDRYWREKSPMERFKRI